MWIASQVQKVPRITLASIVQSPDFEIASHPSSAKLKRMPYNRFSLDRALININFEQILDTSAIVEETITRHLRDIDARWAEMEEDWSDGDRANYEDKLASDVFRIRDVFAQVLRRSLFISAYGIIEQSLDQICINLQKERNYRVLLSDLKDRGIMRSKTYLVKVVGFSFSETAAEWQRIKAYQDLRNYLAHSGPALDRGDPSEQLLKKLKGLKGLDLYEEIDMEPEFLHYVVQDFQSFLNEVYAYLNTFPPVS